MAHSALQYVPGDLELVEQIIYELKSKGIFDQFRKECISDVDTKPAYQNLRQRVEGSVSSYLNRQKWKPEMNKNQLRDKLRKHIQDANYLEPGLERIVDQVVNPKIKSVFIPKVEDLVYTFLGITKPAKSETNYRVLECNNYEDLLPNDLEAVSPVSDKSVKALNISNTKLEDDTKECLSMEIDSPAFEPINKTETNNSDDKIKNESLSRSSSKSSLNIPIPDMPLEDIPIPAEIPLKSVPFPVDKIKESEDDYKTLSNDESSSDSILRNVSPLTPVRSYQNENSSDAQQAFNHNNDKNNIKETTFNFRTNQQEIIKKNFSENSCDSKNESKLAQQFENVNFANSDESSGSNNLQIVFDQSTNNETSDKVFDDIPIDVKDIPLPKDVPKLSKSEHRSSSHRSSKESHRHSSSSRHRDDKHRHHSSSKDDKKSENKSESSRSEHRKNDHEKSRDKERRDKEKTESKDQKDKHSSHKSSTSYSKSSSHRSSSHSSSHKHSSSHRSSDEKKSSGDRKSGSRDRSKDHKSSSKDISRHSSSHYSDKDKRSKSSNSRSKSDSRKNEKKDKKETDDHYSSSGRSARIRRSTDRDSNDGSNSTAKNSQHISSGKVSNNQKTSNGTSSKSETNSTGNESSGQSDHGEKNEVLTKLGNTSASQNDLSHIVKEEMKTFAEYSDDEEMRRQQAAAMLIEIQNAVMPNQSKTIKLFPETSGPELEFICNPNDESQVKEGVHKNKTIESLKITEGIPSYLNMEIRDDSDTSGNNKQFYGFKTNDQISSIVDKETLAIYLNTQEKPKPRLFLYNCDSSIENTFNNLKEYITKNYVKNGHKIKNKVIVIEVDKEIIIPSKTAHIPEKSLKSPCSLECSFESGDYNTRLDDKVSKTSRAEVMEIILGGMIEDVSPSKMVSMEYTCSMSSEDEACRDIASSGELKRKYNIDEIDNNNGMILVPNKIRKMRLSEQISSTTEDSPQTTKSKHLMKARRVGLPRPPVTSTVSPKSPASDLSVENYEETLESNKKIANKGVKVKKTKHQIQRYDTTDLYKPKLHFLSRRSNLNT